ncbi:20638_t:CDS:2, partial [Gigaspora margarita]
YVNIRVGNSCLQLFPGGLAGLLVSVKTCSTLKKEKSSLALNDNICRQIVSQAKSDQYFQKSRWIMTHELRVTVRDISLYLHTSREKLKTFNSFEHARRLGKANRKSWNKRLPTVYLRRSFRSTADSRERIDPNTYMTILEYVDGGTLRQYLEQIFNKMKWNDKLYLAKQIKVFTVHDNNIIHGNLNSENIFIHKGIIKINSLSSQKSEVIGTPRKYSLIHQDCWCHDANKRPSIQYVVAHLNKIVIVEEFEEYAMEEDGSNLLQLFITLFNTTTNSMQIINGLFNHFEIHQIDPSFIFNQFAYQYYNFSMIGYFHEHGIGTDVDYNKAFWMYKLSSEIDIKNILKNNLNNLSLLDNFNVNNYIIGKFLLDYYIRLEKVLIWINLLHLNYV